MQYRASLVVKLVLVIGGTSVALIAQFADPIFYGEQFRAWNVIGMSAAVLAAIGAVFIAVTEQDASKDLEAARAALERAREFEEDIEAYNRAAEETRRAVELYTAMNEMRQVIAQAVHNPNVDTVKAIELCLQTARRSLLIAFGFELEGHWTLAIYIAEKNQRTNKDQLRLIAHERSIPCPIGDGRIWPEGVGVGGVAYAKAAEVIVPDLGASELGSVFNLGTLQKADDYDRYRSVAAVPISIEPASPPWGIAIATSDRPEHFGIGGKPGVQTAEALRALAGMVALAVKVTSSTVGTSPASPNRAILPSEPR
jgi:hypothetical protein